MVGKRVFRIMIFTFLLIGLMVLPAYAAGMKDLVKDDFSEKADGTPLNVGTNDGNWNLSYSGIGSVDTPQVTYEDGAIKISKSAAGANLDLYKKMTDDAIPTSGKVVYSFDVKYSPHCTHSVFASDFIFRLAPDLANMGDRLPRNQLFYSLHYVNGGDGGHLLFTNNNNDMFYPKTLIGTDFDWYHFEYTVDYDNNKYSVKIADKVMPYLESDKIIPQGFIDNGGGTYFQTVLVTSNLGADVPNLEMYIKNFTVTTGETMWPEENALTVTDVLSNTATLNWNPLDTNGVTGYEIYKNDELIDTIMNPNQTSYTVSNLTGSTTYDFSVKPLFADTETYDKSLNISVTTGGVILRENVFQQLSAGRTHIIGANKNTVVKAWGGNSMGQTNSGMTKPAAKAAAGAFSSYVIDLSGNVYAWGSNSSRQLGIGSSDLTVPNPVVIPTLNGVKSVAAGKEHALALTDDGKVYAWGNNRFGQLGTGNSDTVLEAASPVLISALSDKKVVGIYTGGDTSFAVCEDGTLFGWGMNYVGQLADANLNNKDVPTLISIPGMKVLSVAAGNGHTIALCYSETESKTSVWGWGNDGQAQLGSGDLGSIVSVPVRLTYFDNLNINEISAGDSHTLALSGDGDLYVWGNNTSGQLGTGGAAYGVSPTKVLNIPPLTAICAGYDFSAASAADGSLWAWGNNDFGQINPDGGAQKYNLPTRVNLKSQTLGCVSATLSDGQNTYEQIPPTGGNYQLKIDYYNSGAGIDAKVLAAVYSETEQGTILTDAVSADIAIPAESQSGPISVPIVLPDNTEHVMIKVFVWDKLSHAPFTTAVQMLREQ